MYQKQKESRRFEKGNRDEKSKMKDINKDKLVFVPQSLDQPSYAFIVQHIESSYIALTYMVKGLFLLDILLVL